KYDWNLKNNNGLNAITFSLYYNRDVFVHHIFDYHPDVILLKNSDGYDAVQTLLKDNSIQSYMVGNFLGCYMTYPISYENMKNSINNFRVDGLPALHYTYLHNYTERFEMLIKSNYTDLHVKDLNGQTIYDFIINNPNPNLDTKTFTLLKEKL